MSGLVRAARHLTILPLPGSATTSLTGLGAAAPWFPVVGLGLGAALLILDRALLQLFPPLLAALLVVTAWKVLTGGLHLDGLADCLDGLAGHTPEQRRHIMADSRLGTFGALGLILFLMLEIVTVAELDPRLGGRALLVVPALGRATSPVLARLLRPARHQGQGATFAREVTAGGVAIALLIAVGAALLALDGAAPAAKLTAFGAAGAAAWFLAGRVGGLTGDILGAGVEIAELAGLLAVVAWVRVRR